MNHSPTLGSNIRRIQLRPMITDAVFLHDPKDRSRTCKKDPLVFRRSYDISAACMRQSDHIDKAPVSMHIRGECTTSLLRCAVIGAAVVGAAVSVSVLMRMRLGWQIRRKYARRYADRLNEQRLRMQIRQMPDEKQQSKQELKK